MGYIVGILAIVAGAFMVVKTEAIVSMFGTSALAEQYLGTSGGTRLMYKLMGILFIVIALMGMTGLLGKVILAIIGPLFGIR